MRQLKGKVKESRKEKRERKQENMNNKENIKRIVLPTLGLIIAIVIGFIYMNTHPRAENSV